MPESKQMRRVPRSGRSRSLANALADAEQRAGKADKAEAEAQAEFKARTDRTAGKVADKPNTEAKRGPGRPAKTKAQS